MKKIILLLCIFTFPIVSFSQTSTGNKKVTPKTLEERLVDARNIGIEKNINAFEKLPGEDISKRLSIKSMENMEIIRIGTYLDVKTGNFFFMWLKNEKDHSFIKVDIGNPTKTNNIDLMAKMVNIAYSLGETIDIVIQKADNKENIILRSLKIHNTQY